MEVECKRSNVQAIKYTYLYLVVSEPKHCPLGARSHAGAQRRVHEGYKRASTAVSSLPHPLSHSISFVVGEPER